MHTSTNRIVYKPVECGILGPYYGRGAAEAEFYLHMQFVIWDPLMSPDWAPIEFYEFGTLLWVPVECSSL